MDYNELALKQHKDLKGKIYLQLKDKLDSAEKLSTYYTPGVAAVSSYVSEHPDEARDYTWLNNNVAVISDGSAVLGLGDIGPYGALPVMEGKAMLFKHFADIDAVPIILDVHDVESIISTIKAIAPSFGGINLEDIAAPQCFEIEERLKDVLQIPVFHDDQHGTAIVVLAGLINAMKVVNKNLNQCKIVCSGVGAAGVAIMKLIKLYAKDSALIAVDSKGIIDSTRQDLNSTKKNLIDKNIINGDTTGTLNDALDGADIFIGVSKGGLLSKEMVRSMADKSIIFAMANPDPEILPSDAKDAGVAVMATGRSDFPNQVNNALAFPGIFRGALDNKVRSITDDHKIAAAKVIASLVVDPSPKEIIPSVLDDRLVDEIARIIK